MNNDSRGGGPGGGGRGGSLIPTKSLSHFPTLITGLYVHTHTHTHICLMLALVEELYFTIPNKKVFLYSMITLQVYIIIIYNSSWTMCSVMFQAAVTTTLLHSGSYLCSTGSLAGVLIATALG